MNSKTLLLLNNKTAEALMSKESANHLVPVPKDYEATQEGLASIPTALSEWSKGNDNPVWSIAAFGNGDYLTAGATQYISWWLNDTQTPHAWLYHRPLDLTEKEAMFSLARAAIAEKIGSNEPTRPVKTVTLSLPTEGSSSPYVAITSLAQQINNPVRRAVADSLGISPKVVKAARFNPPEIDAPVTLGLQAGVVGPFLPLAAAERIRAWFYLRGDTSEATPVEIAVSQKDSLIIQRQGFESLIADYNKDFLQGYAQFIPIEAPE